VEKTCRTRGKSKNNITPLGEKNVPTIRNELTKNLDWTAVNLEGSEKAKQCKFHRRGGGERCLLLDKVNPLVKGANRIMKEAIGGGTKCHERVAGPWEKYTLKSRSEKGKGKRSESESNNRP